MSIYIDNGKTVKHYCTNKKTDKAIITLLEQMDIAGSETKEGYRVAYTEREVFDYDEPE